MYAHSMPNILALLSVILVVCTGSIASQSPSVFQDGEKGLQFIAEKRELPRYGDCWSQALKEIHEGCGRLTEHMQSKLALLITDCFLEMSEEVKYECARYTKLADRQKCIKNMPDRAFNVYSEFYTHAQNICFFLKSFIWQESTEQSINKLASVSHTVRERLVQIKDAHTSLIENQKQSLLIQQDIMQHGVSLGQVLQESRASVHTLMQELRRSTQEQAGALGQLASKLSALQAWAIGEVSWIESIIYYIVTLLVSYLMTSLPRTQNARLWIFMLLSLGLLMEQTFYNWKLSHDQSEDTPADQQGSLYHWIWRLRMIVVGLCFVTFFYCVYSYKDYMEINYQMLMAIHDQVVKMSAGQTHSELGGHTSIDETKGICLTAVETPTTQVTPMAAESPLTRNGNITAEMTHEVTQSSAVVTVTEIDSNRLVQTVTTLRTPRRQPRIPRPPSLNSYSLRSRSNTPQV